MNPRRLVASLAVAAAIGVTSIIIVGDELPPQSGDVFLGPEKAARLPDGGTTYAREARASDGGRVVRLVSAECVRRLADAGAAACRQRMSDGGVRDPGMLNRFSADAAVGARCQVVACSVWAGDDADEEESVIVGRRNGPQNEKSGGR